MNNELLPGVKVYYNRQVGKVLERGASSKGQYVIVDFKVSLFKSLRRTFYNNDLKALTKVGKHK